MTKQLKDLFEQFSTMETSRQLEKIREIRHHRSIERPAAAVKRVKKEIKRSEKKKRNVAALLKGLTPEQRAALVARLQGELGVNDGSSGEASGVADIRGDDEQAAVSALDPSAGGPSDSDSGSSSEGDDSGDADEDMES